jgi:hypothetical protein
LDEELLLFFTDPELRPDDLLPLLLFERGFTALPLEPELLRRWLLTVPLRDRLELPLELERLPVEFQTRVLRWRGCTVLLLLEPRLRLFCTPVLLLLPLLELVPVLRLLPTVVGELLEPRPLDVPPTRDVPRQSSLLRVPRVTGTRPARCPSPAAVWRRRLASVLPPLRPELVEFPDSRIRRPPWLRPVLEVWTKLLRERLVGSAPR